MVGMMYGGVIMVGMIYDGEHVWCEYVWWG